MDKKDEEESERKPKRMGRDDGFVSSHFPLQANKINPTISDDYLSLLDASHLDAIPYS